MDECGVGACGVRAHGARRHGALDGRECSAWRMGGAGENELVMGMGEGDGGQVGVNMQHVRRRCWACMRT